MAEATTTSSGSDLIEVELVAADRTVWTGRASMVIARTTDGEVGILPHHAPLLGALVNGAVLVRLESGDPIVAAVHGGFLSVADNRVGILAEQADLAADIDIDAEQHELGEARQSDDDDSLARVRRAEARIRAHSMVS